MANEVTKLLTEKTGKLSFADAVMIALGTPLVDAGFRMVGVGNTGLVPNGLKLAGAWGLSMIDNPITKILSTSALVSATTGLLDTFLPGIMGAKTSSSGQSGATVVGGSDANQGLLPGVTI